MTVKYYAKMGPEGLNADKTMDMQNTLRDIRGEVPQSQGAVPGSRQGKLSIGGDDNITHKVRVALQSTLGGTIAGLITGQLPHDDRLV